MVRRAAGAAVCLLVLCCGGGPPRPAPPERAIFRLTFGVTDREPADWSGSVEATTGRVAALTPWRFDQDDQLEAGGHTWRCRTRFSAAPDPAFWWLAAVPAVPESLEKPPGNLIPNGLYVHVENAAEVRVKTRQGAFSFRPADLRMGEMLGVLQGRAQVERTPAAFNLTAGDDAEDDYPAVAVDEQGNSWIAWIRYRNQQEQLMVARFPHGKPMAVAKGEFYRPALAVRPGGPLHLAASVHHEGTWKIAVWTHTADQWSGPEIISSGGPDLAVRAAVDVKGKLWVVWQGLRQGRSQIAGRVFDGEKWEPEFIASANRANAWEPALARDHRGGVHLAWDAYEQGHYDIYYRRFDGERFHDAEAITSSPRFEAHAAVACDPSGRVWLAWDEAGANWGKDTGFLVRPKTAEALYEQRQVRVVVLTGRGLLEAPPLSRMLSGGPREFLEQPQLAADAAGNVWCLVRRRYTKWHEASGPALPENRPQPHSFWDYVAYRFAGNTALPVTVPFSFGRNDQRAAIAAAPGGRLTLAWAADGRTFARPYPFVKNDVYLADLPGAPYGEPSLQPWRAPPPASQPVPGAEAKQVARLRETRLRAGGKVYRVLRGDLHRCTDLSFDGHGDGSLWDLYRYALDAADLDFAAVTDHQAGGDNEYLWRLIQKSCSLFHYPERFTPLYAYKRSLRFPNGQRNLIWAKGGVRTLPRSQAEEEGKEGAQRLYEYLRLSGGVAIPHAPATAMGNGWRDHDPELEPLVEIYQGNRTSYEHEGAPRAARRDEPLTQPGGFEPEGFVWNAWAKGHKLGVIASSGHGSTHISYAVLLAERNSREALLEAMRARRAYAATDNILVDFRCGERLQGESFSLPHPPRFDIRVEGTAPIAQIDLVRNNRYVFRAQPRKPQAALTYQDREPLRGETYYYIRVEQADGQLAWSSPIWVRPQ